MKNKDKFLWIYSFALFFVAFILILFAAFTANDYQQKAADSLSLYRGAENQIQNLQDENRALKNELDRVQKEYEDYKSKVNEDEIKQKDELLQNYIAETEKIFKANDLFYKGLYDECKELLDSVDLGILGKEAKDYHKRLYNDLNIALKNRAKKK
ncbi:MAG: hypothetical protein GX196_05960 [Clostridiaceae bacterium]|mgnify:CR=1 FL=1|nr:hypothetical protein [Clostridiaceae bacterium]